jgi:hypothetical protein
MRHRLDEFCSPASPLVADESQHAPDGFGEPIGNLKGVKATFTHAAAVGFVNSIALQIRLFGV